MSDVRSALEDRGYRIVHVQEPILASTGPHGGETSVEVAQTGEIRAEKIIDGRVYSFMGANEERLLESVDSFEAHFAAVRGVIAQDGSVEPNERPEGMIISDAGEARGSVEALAESVRHLDVESGEVQFNERDALKDLGVGKQTEEGVNIDLSHPDDANRERLSGQDRNLNPTEVHNVPETPANLAKRERLDQDYSALAEDLSTDRDGDGMDPLRGVDLGEAPDLEESIQAQGDAEPGDDVDLAGPSDELAESAEPDATEAARARAEEAGLDLSEVEGTGKDGRITAADVDDYTAGSDEPV